ncbi:MAG: ABC transporter permease [Blautia sp.]|nr:ABC transporter permease [Blautia sp.]
MRANTKLQNAYLAFLFFLMYLPVAIVILFSFNESKLYVSFSGFSLVWYEKLFRDSAMMEALKNSLILGILSCAVSAVIGTLGAVSLSALKLRSKGVLEYIAILPLMVPEIILGMVLMAFFYMLKLPFGMLTLLIGHTVFCVPYILVEVKASLALMDPSLTEAARDLGASSWRAFLDITLPLVMPAVASGSLLAFAMSMDDVVISIFINGPRISTLPIKVYTQIKTGVTPEINALCTIMLAVSLTALAVFSIFRSHKKEENRDEEQIDRASEPDQEL